MINKVEIVIGHWNDYYEIIKFESNKTVDEINCAFEKSINKLGLIFNQKILYLDYEEILKNIENKEEKNEREILWYTNTLSELSKNILEEHGIKTHKEYTSEKLIELIINVIKLSLPDLTMKKIATKDRTIPRIGGLHAVYGHGIFLKNKQERLRIYINRFKEYLENYDFDDDSVIDLSNEKYKIKLNISKHI